jgi:hypothetical protein
MDASGLCGAPEDASRPSSEVQQIGGYRKLAISLKE